MPVLADVEKEWDVHRACGKTKSGEPVSDDDPMSEDLFLQWLREAG
jgi:hypothetical protein